MCQPRAVRTAVSTTLLVRRQAAQISNGTYPRWFRRVVLSDVDFHWTRLNGRAQCGVLVRPVLGLVTGRLAQIDVKPEGLNQVSLYQISEVDCVYPPLASRIGSLWKVEMSKTALLSQRSGARVPTDHRPTWPGAPQRLQNGRPRSPLDDQPA